MRSAVKRIIVACDHLDVRSTLGRWIALQGHDVNIADRGIEAAELVRPETDLVVVDAHLYGTDGFTVTRAIRGSEAVADVPILLVTDPGEPEERRQAIEAGATDIIDLPIDVAELRLRVGSLLRLKEAQDQAAQCRARCAGPATAPGATNPAVAVPHPAAAATLPGPAKHPLVP
jgi:putative two-component system response regulator